jgi:hypothetical protein
LSFQSWRSSFPVERCLWSNSNDAIYLRWHQYLSHLNLVLMFAPPSPTNSKILDNIHWGNVYMSHTSQSPRLANQYVTDSWSRPWHLPRVVIFLFADPLKSPQSELMFAPIPSYFSQPWPLTSSKIWQTNNSILLLPLKILLY